MRVLLTSYGSTGDIYPGIALARALEASGHEAVFATAPAFRAEIEAAGVRFRPVPPLEWSLEDFKEGSRALNAIASPLAQLKAIYRGIEPYFGPFLDELEAELPGYDLLVGTYLLPPLKEVARRHGVPFAALCFCHNVVPSPEITPPNVPSLDWLPLPLRRAGNRFLWRAADDTLDRAFNGILGEALRSRGLPPQRRWTTHPADCVLVTVSETLFRPAEATLPPAFHFCGYLRWQPAHLGAEAEAARAFADGARVPVVTFGSMVFERPEEKLGAFLRTWPRGRKLILQSGWAGLKAVADRPEVKVVGPTVHDTLFALASVIVHHGGAGTTASALHAGRPQVVVPHIADQPFWAREVKRLGVGVPVSKKRWPDRLTGLIDQLEGDSSVAVRAAEAAAALEKEDGPACAVRVLEAFVKRWASGAVQLA